MNIEIPGVGVGHWTDSVGRTGCTVVTVPAGTVASCEVRGGAPASRELTALAPDKSVAAIDAIVLTGGSAFGLGAADGVLQYLEELGRGVSTPAGRVPVVPTLALFDLGVGDAAVRPTAASGYAAARAVSGEQPLWGRVGAGAGAYVGHWRGPEGRRPGGLAYAQRRLGDVVVGALCVVNAFGDIDVGGGEVALDAVAALEPPFGFGSSESAGGEPVGGEPVVDGSVAVERDGARTHTTIGAVVTNARLDKSSCRIVAQGAHDGLARALTPPHTRFDGDGFVAAATGAIDTHVDVVRLLALAAVADAIRSVGRGVDR